MDIAGKNIPRLESEQLEHASLPNFLRRRAKSMSEKENPGVFGTVTAE